MKKLLLLALIVALAWFGTVIADRERLNGDLLRVCVWSDSEDMQSQSLVRKLTKEFGGYLDTVLDGSGNYLLGNSVNLGDEAEVLQQYSNAGTDMSATMTKSAFESTTINGTVYPSGVYDTLKIVIGNENNADCIQMMVLRNATQMISGKQLLDIFSQNGKSIRFYALDLLGRIENFLFGL